MLVFIGLFISTGASAYYDVKVEVYEHPEELANIMFNGQPPETVGDFDHYTIEKFELKIGNVNRYPVTKHTDTNLITSVNNIEDLDYIVDQWPSSYLVLTYKLTFQQFTSEEMKCVSKHFDWWDAFWWLEAPYTNCFAKAWNAYFFNQTERIDITSALKDAVEQEIENVNREIKEIDFELKQSTEPSFMYHKKGGKVVRIDLDDSTDTDVLIEVQSKVVFGFATIEYLYNSKMLSEVVDRLSMANDFVRIFHYLANEEIAVELLTAYESVNCKEKLPQNISDNFEQRPRLLSMARKYALNICKYNQASFERNNKSKNPSAREFHEPGTDANTPVYIPYVFCDGYTCQFNLSETHKYRVVDFGGNGLHHSYFHMSGIADIYAEYFGVMNPTSTFSDKLCKDDSCFSYIDDASKLKIMFDDIKNKLPDWNESIWYIIEIED
jgi:hypothetical protein